MSERSLKASKRGITLAKSVLKSRGLTQKAFGKELGISWPTINRFFTGKNIDRTIFIDEICLRLNLDWEEVISEVAPEASNLFKLVQENSGSARNALSPYILPRIRRQALLDKCVAAIKRGVEGQRRVIPILGAAGYGKSIILSSIYDELEAEIKKAGQGWVGLFLCSNVLTDSIENIAVEIGQQLSGQRLSIVQIATILTENYGRGVLLIDTLDIILQSKLVPIFRQLVTDLLERGVTVVFTCRDQDYQDFFTPYPESFAGFFDIVEPRPIAGLIHSLKRMKNQGFRANFYCSKCY
jgi:transcriptional regulator with XRE-family HTH domain